MRERVAVGGPVRLEVRPHGIVLVAPLARAIAMAVVGGALVVVGSRSVWLAAFPGVILLAVAAVAALRAVLVWDRTRVVVTRDELVVVHGLVRRRSSVASRGGLEVDESLLGRLFGYGTLVAGDLEVPYVPDARNLARTL